MNASKVQKDLDRIKNKHKSLTPEIVVEEAKSPKSPLHKAFDWSDTKAAKKWRLHQARQLIRAVWIIATPKAEPQPVFAYVPNKENGKPKKGSYKAVAEIITDEEMYQMAYSHLVECMSNSVQSVNALESAARKMGHKRVKVIATIIKAVEVINDALDELRIA